MLIGIVKKDDLRTLFFRKSQQLTDTFATVGIYGHENIGKLMFHLIRFVTISWLVLCSFARIKPEDFRLYPRLSTAIL